MNEAATDSWTDSEQAIARAAFETAYNRAVMQLVASVQSKAVRMSLHDSGAVDLPLMR